MDGKRLVTINVTFGTLFLLAGAAYPFVERAMTTSRATVGAEGLVHEVLRSQRRANADKDAGKTAYVYFPATNPGRDSGLSSLAMTPPTSGYTVEAFRDAQSVLVIRAYPSPDALRASDIPAVVYEHRIRNRGEDGQGRWLVAP